MSHPYTSSGPRAILRLQPLTFLVLPLVLAEVTGAAPLRMQSAGHLLQGFDGPDGEDTAAFRRDERAIWGRGSALSATSHFTGTGGPGGGFVWVIQTGETFEFDTTSTTITSADLSTTQVAVGGVVDVRDLFILPGGVLRIRGPNPFRLRATHEVIVQGRIVASGVDHPSYSLFNTGFPSPGSIGGPGGGRGGSSSLTANASTPRGETGYGAWNVALGGGTGGEAGYNGNGGDFCRGSGGGGGRFGADIRSSATGCPLQTWIGLDAEQGGPGAPQASGADSGPGVVPVPGVPNTSPFVDSDPTNDFWGRMVTSAGATIVGELPTPWAGAGGGAGGDAVQSYTFPNPNFTPSSDEVGGGGGGGGGSLLIQALGGIQLYPDSLIEVDGGCGGGGENTSGLNHIGSAGGGGSGGHLILQAAAIFFLSPGLELTALGGQGGSGRNNVGGAQPGGVATTPALDSINLVAPYDPNCLVPAPMHANVVGSGGDGGPGIIQLHVPSTADLHGFDSVSAQPPPVGIHDPANPSTWDLLQVPYGPESMSRSRWMSLAGSGPIDVRFAGTDASGYVRASGIGRVLRLGAVAAGTIAVAPNTPYVDVDGRTLVIDAASITDPVWSDPALLVGAELALVSTSGSPRFDVGLASRVGATMRLTVSEAGAPLAPYGAGTTYTLYPRTFRVATDGVRDFLPTITSSIRITFQGAPDDGTGAPDLALASAWSPDANLLESVPGLAFVRFQVEFDMAAGFFGLTAETPRPSLEFLRIPYLR